DGRVDRQLQRGPGGGAAGDDVDQPLVEEAVVGAGEQRVAGPLQPLTGPVGEGVVARDVGVAVGAVVDALPLQHVVDRLGAGHGRAVHEDGAPVAAVAVDEGAPVAGPLPQVVSLDELDPGGGDEQGGEHGQHDDGQ